MQLLTVYPGSINRRHIEAAAEAMRQGHLIIFPTDSVYAIGCDALNQRAIERLCRAKGLNPDKNLLSILCADISQAAEYARIDNKAFRYLKEYLPGAYTFILPASTRLPKVFKGRKTVGVRVPDNAIARAIAEELGNPVLTSSVDIADPDEMRDPEAVAMHYANTAALAIDGGDGGNIPSTIVDLTDTDNPEIVRQGAATFNE